MDELKRLAKDHTKILDEAAAIQDEWAGKRMTTEVGEKFDALCTEAQEIQDQMDRLERLQSLETKRREVREPTLPQDKIEPAPQRKDKVAGYITLGDAILASDEFQNFAAKGYPRMGAAALQLQMSLLGFGRKSYNPNGLVPLTKEQRELFETKAVPTLGAGVIESDRVPGLWRSTEDDELRVRDVMNVSATSSDTVAWIREDSFTRAAAETAHGASKPEATVAYSEQTATVRTIAVWMPVQVQQLQDFPALRNLIDNRLRYDVALREEEQILYSDGVAPNITNGLFVDSGVTDIASNGRYDSSFDTLIDVIRMGITDTRTAGYRPNACLIHPVDWETIILLKATDNNYIWAVVTDENGSRLWNLRVVECEACEENSGEATPQRNLLVGDFQRGVTLYDRMQTQVMVGMQNDDFTKNLRTILAEERIALALQAPAAFAKFQTQAEVT